jgi:hypothetical protein
MHAQEVWWYHWIGGPAAERAPGGFVLAAVGVEALVLVLTVLVVEAVASAVVVAIEAFAPHGRLACWVEMSETRCR